MNGNKDKKKHTKLKTSDKLVNMKKNKQMQENIHKCPNLFFLHKGRVARAKK